MQIRFHGAVGGQVTGSCTEFYYPRTKTRFLVDCGMVQGEAHANALNNKNFDFDPSSIKFVLLTHAHLDHCGLIPKLYRKGFGGKVLCTKATADAAKFILFDATNLEGCPYDKGDVDRVSFEYVDERKSFAFSQFTPIDKDLFVALTRSAHLPGAVSISVQWVSEGDLTTSLRQIVLSGDLGPNTDKNQYQSLQSCLQVPYGWPDYLILESTYGGRSRDPKYTDRSERLKALDEVVRSSLIDRGGTLIIPAFAMQRTPDILFDLYCLYGRLNEGLSILGTMMDIDQFNKFVECKTLPTNKIKVLKQVADEQGNSKYGSVWIESIFTPYKDANKLIDESTLTINRLQEYMTKSKTRLTLPIFIHLESTLALKLLPVWLESLKKRQGQNKLFYRNKHLSEWLGVQTEEDVDKILDTIFGFTNNQSKANSCVIGGIVIKVKKFKISNKNKRAILISSGGMCEGGPVVNHLPEALKMKDMTIAITGYMAQGTAGANILNQLEKPKEERHGEIEISINDKKETINAEEIEAEMADLRGFYSCHADVDGLCNYALTVYTDGKKQQTPKPIYIFINHGDKQSMINLKKELEARAGKNGLREVASVEHADATGRWFNLDTREYMASEMSLNEKMDMLLHGQKEIKEILSALLKRDE